MSKVERGAERVRGEQDPRLEGLEAHGAALAHRLERFLEQTLFSPFRQPAEPVGELAEKDLEQARNANLVAGLSAHGNPCECGLRTDLPEADGADAKGRIAPPRATIRQRLPTP